MPASSGQNSRQRAKPTARQPVEPSPPTDRPFLRFYHSDDLRVRTLAVLTALEQSPDGTQHRDALADIVLELTGSGMEYYFIRPLQLAQVGSVIEQSAQLGIGGVVRVMAFVIRRVMGKMDQRQLLTVSSHIRDLME